MNELSDVLLDLPAPVGFLRWTLFFTFVLHFTFVLLTLGTAILGIFDVLRRRFGGARDADVSPLPLRHFFVYKSLAISFGVAPILVMQVLYPAAFLTAVGLLAPLWLLLAPLLVAALVLIELVAERKDRERPLLLVGGVAGLACLLAVPGIFAAVVATAERPELWAEIHRRAGSLTPALSLHWLWRVLHVLGAAVVVTAALQLALARPGDAQRRRRLAFLAGAALAFQLGLGVALYASLDRRLSTLALAALVLGVGCAGLLAWQLRPAPAVRSARRLTILAALCLGIVLPMLVVRQELQKSSWLPLLARLQARAEARRVTLADAGAFPPGPLLPSMARDDALSIYATSCKFCHGAVANGQGPAAADLAVPPEDLADYRVRPDDFRRLVAGGVPGTAMPRFNYYGPRELDRVYEFLLKAGLSPRLEEVPAVVPEAARRRAAAIWETECRTCHGDEGAGSRLARGFSPPPPDFNRVAVAPARAFEVVTAGYAGTMMPSYADLPEPTRWALVRVTQDFYRSAGRARHGPAPRR
jgi:mono/diheme cytochrome c family protein